MDFAKIREDYTKVGTAIDTLQKAIDVQAASVQTVADLNTQLDTAEHAVTTANDAVTSAQSDLAAADSTFLAIISQAAASGGAPPLAQPSALPVVTTEEEAEAVAPAK